MRKYRYTCPWTQRVETVQADAMFIGQNGDLIFYKLVSPTTKEIPILTVARGGWVGAWIESEVTFNAIT